MGESITLNLIIENNIDIKRIIWGIVLLLVINLPWFFFCCSIVACWLIDDRECLWFSISKLLFSSLFTRPLSPPLNSDDEQMIPVRIYNSRLNSTPINDNNETHRSAIYTTLHSERCFHAKEFICLNYIFIIFSFACILSLILLASPIPACFNIYIDMIFAWMVARVEILKKTWTRELLFMHSFFHLYLIYCFIFYRFDPATIYKRANTTLTPTNSMTMQNLSSAGVRRSYAPMSNTPSNVLLNSTTRKPRSYISSATSITKT
jgi:hypothetical protein